MKKVYFDTSAFVKIFVEERASQEVESLVTLARDKKMMIALSDWVLNESIAVIDANNRQGIINDLETHQILSEMIGMVEGNLRYENIDIYPVTEMVVIASRIVMQDYHIGASDAIHVFISGASDCDYFISADHKLIRQLTRGKYKLPAFDIHVQEDIDKLFELVGI